MKFQNVLIFLLFPILASSQSFCDLDLGDDIYVCNNANFQLNPNPTLMGGKYTWVGANLNCFDCPSPRVSGLPTGVYTYIIHYEDGTCQTADTLEINVVDGEQPKYIILEDTMTCGSVSLNLGGPLQPGTIDVIWSSAPAGFSSFDPNPSIIASESKVYYLDVFNNSCPFASRDSVHVSVFQKPILSVVPSSTICQGSSIVLGSTVGSPDDAFSWSPVLGLDDPNSPNPTASPENSTTYVLQFSNPGCKDSAKVEIVVKTIDLKFEFSDSTTLCKGGSLEVLATPSPSNAQISWMPSPGLSVSPDGKNATLTPTESTTYAIFVSTSDCDRNFEIDVKLDSLPANLAISPQDKTICLGESVFLQSNPPTFNAANFPGIKFEWQGNGLLDPPGNFNMNVSPSTMQEFLRISTFGVCADTQRAKINVIVPPAMEIFPKDTLVCPNSPVKLTLKYDPQITGVQWSPSTGLSCSDCSEPVATVSNSTTYTAQGVFQNCPAKVSAKVNTKPLPVYQFPDDTERILCTGQGSVQLNENFTPGATYTWSSTDPSFGTMMQNQISVSPSSNQTYFLLVELDGCMVQDKVEIEVFKATLNVDGDTMICKNVPTTLSATGSLAGTYEWSPGNLTGQNVQVMPAQTTVFTVTYSYGHDNVCKLQKTVEVQITGEAPALFFPTDQDLCPGESIQLNNDPAPNPNANYTWVSEPPSFTSGFANPSETPAASKTYKVTAMLGNCTVEREFSVTVHNATLSVSMDSTICEGDVATISAIGTGINGAYEWTPGGASSQLVIQPIKTDTFSLVYTHGDGCQLRDSVIIQVVKGISIEFFCDPDTNRLDIGDPISLTAEVEPFQSLTGFTFQWSLAGESAGSTQTIEPETSINFPSETDSVLNLQYNVLVTSQFGCQASESKTITLVRPTVVLPNAFTPGNGDDKNNTFRPVILRGKIAIESMEVFTRWGEKIYEAVGQTAAWDGTDDSGNEMPSDTYLYVVKYRRGDGALQPFLSGDVTLIR